MKNFIKKIKSEHILLILSSALLLAVLVPIFLVGVYDRITSWDDVAYSLEIRNLIYNGGSFVEVISAIWEKFITYYNNWQGTYSSIIMFSLEPAIWGHKFYATTPFIMVAVVYLSTLYFSKVLLQIFNKENRGLFISLANLIVLISLYFMPSINNGIFWYNGAMHYTFFYSLQVIYIAICLKFLTSDNIKHFWVKFPFLIAFAFILSGSNLVTMLLNACLTATILGLSFIFKKPHKVVGLFFLCFIFAMLGLFVNIWAPGNGVRQYYEPKMEAFPAFIASIQHIWEYIKVYTYAPLFLASLLFISTFWKSAKISEFKFKLPLIVLLVSLSVLGASSMPPYYASSYEGPERLQNIVYFSYVLLFFVNFIYFAGWLAKSKIGDKIKLPKAISIALIAVLIASFVGTTIADYKKSNIANVMVDVPIAREYGAEWDEVWKILESSYNGHVRVPFPEYFPYTLTQFYDFGSKRNSAFDIAFARFTNKMSFGFIGNERIILSRFRDSVTIGTKEMPVSFLIKTSDLDGRLHYINLRTLATLLKQTSARFDIQALGHHNLKILRNFPVEKEYIGEIPYTGKTYDVEQNPITLIIDGQRKNISAFYWDDKCYVALREFSEVYGGFEVSADNKKGVIITVHNE